MATITGAANLAAITVQDVTDADHGRRDLPRPERRRDPAALASPVDMLATNRTNLEAANSRIVDVDVA